MTIHQEGDVVLGKVQAAGVQQTAWNQPQQVGGGDHRNLPVPGLSAPGNVTLHCIRLHYVTIRTAGSPEITPKPSVDLSQPPLISPRYAARPLGPQCTQTHGASGVCHI